MGTVATWEKPENQATKPDAIKRAQELADKYRQVHYVQWSFATNQWAIRTQADWAAGSWGETPVHPTIKLVNKNSDSL